MAKRSNGEGSVRENKARGRWEGRITTGMDPEGKPVRRMVTGRTRREVLDRMREAQDATESGLDPAPVDLTVRRFLEQWVRDVLPGTVAATTEEQYANIVRLYIIPTIGQKRLRTLRAMDVAGMLRQLDEAGKAPNTRRLARSVLRRALRWAEAEGMVARNVAALANGVKIGRPDNADKALTVAEARQLLAHVSGDRFEAAIVVGLSLGLRRGEILGLAWDDLDLDATPPRLTVTHNLVRVTKLGLIRGETKTVGSRRRIQLPGPVVDALRRHRVAQLEERASHRAPHYLLLAAQARERVRRAQPA